MADFTPSSDTYSNEYRLDCLAKHKLNTQTAVVIRKWLSGLKDADLKKSMQIRLDYFKDSSKEQQDRVAFKNLPYQQGIQQCRSMLRNNLVNQGKLKKTT